VKIEPVTSKPALIRLGRRHEYLPPENLLIKWRSHAGCGFNLSTCQPCVCSDTYDAVPICRGGNAYFVGCADAASSVDQRSASNGTISADKDIFAT